MKCEIYFTEVELFTLIDMFSEIGYFFHQPGHYPDMKLRKEFYDIYLPQIQSTLRHLRMFEADFRNQLIEEESKNSPYKFENNWPMPKDPYFLDKYKGAELTDNSVGSKFYKIELGELMLGKLCTIFSLPALVFLPGHDVVDVAEYWYKYDYHILCDIRRKVEKQIPEEVMDHFYPD